MVKGVGTQRRQDTRDCNPLINRLPAQVVSRRRNAPEETGDGADASVDRKVVFAMKPDQRFKWLEKALKQVAEGMLGTNDIYDIVASSRFAEEVQPKVGRKMSRAVREQLGLFSAKQQRFLSSEAVLFVKFGAMEIQEESERAAKAKKVESKEPPDSTAAEEMLARCRAFMREKAQERGELTAVPGEPEAADATLESMTNGTGDVPAKEPGSEALPEASKLSAVDDEKQVNEKVSKKKTEVKAAKKKASAKDAASRSSSDSSRARKPKKAEHAKDSKKSIDKAESAKESKKRRRSSSSSSTSSRDAKKKKSSKQKSKRKPSSSSSSSDSSSSSKAARKRSGKRQKQRRRSSSSDEPSKTRASKRKKA